MKTLQVIWIIVIINILACDKLDLKVEVPGCIEKKIKEFKDSRLTCDSGAQVLRYDFQGEQVYVFDRGNCGADMPLEVYDNHCHKICSLGGIEGNTICDSLIFEENESNRLLLWKN